MLDQGIETGVEDAQKLQGQEFDLVVIGAGIAGLNALYAASEYLPKGARALLLDQKGRPGGMWNTAYDYVRLHQPHPMFTVGDLKWNWRKPRDYLAAREEVQSHLNRSLEPVAKKLDFRAAFGQTVSQCTEVETPQGPRAEIIFHPNSNDQVAKVTAKRAIHASGLNYEVAEPLPLSSKKVVSIIPQELRATLQAHPDAPVVVVGGGKTAMDTVLATLSISPGRKVSLVKGRGTNFLNRTKYVPTGLKRWTSGELVSRLFRDMALTFDGTNEEESITHFRVNHSTDPDGDNGVFLYGLQSEEEAAKIKAGVTATFTDYLEDVVDDPAPVLAMRSGAAIPTADGSIIVNCTGSFFRTEALADPMPLISPNNCILTINARDGFHFLTSVSGFFMTHLLYRDHLRGQGFYRLDLEDLFGKDRNAWVGASAAQAYMNQVIAVQTLPMTLLDRCGLDLDRWYPLPRRMAGLLRMKATATRDIAHCRKTLDHVAKRFDVLAAPLD